MKWIIGVVRRTSYIWPILIGAGLSLALSLVFVELASADVGRHWLIGLAVVCFVSPMAVVTMALRRSFGRASRDVLITTVLASYVSLIVTFTGVYYALSTVGDVADAIHAYEFYTKQREALAAGTLEAPVRRDLDERAFAGIPARLWSDPLTTIREEATEPWWEPTPEELIRSTERPRNEIVLWQPRSRLPVLISCLHLSVATSTTLGYGDISPRRWYSILLTDLQVLTAVLLTGFGVAMIFADWGQAVDE